MSDVTGSEKIDLHRHLEGAIRPETAVALGVEAGVFPVGTSVETFVQRALVRKPMPLLTVLSRFDLLREPITCYEAVKRISREAVEDGQAEGLTALNLRFSPMTLAPAAGLSVPEVFRAIQEGIVEAREAGATLAVELMAIISRGRGVETAWQLIKHLEDGAAALVHAVDFASDEIRFATSLFGEVAEAIAQMDLPLSIHTGEGVGPSAIWEAIALPNVRRLGHALSLLEDDTLVQEVIDRGLLIEVSPSSNLLTTLVASPEEHPARGMFERGVAMAICTDDPGLFGIDLDHELQLAQTHWNISRSQLQTMQQAARDVFVGA